MKEQFNHDVRWTIKYVGGRVHLFYGAEDVKSFTALGFWEAMDKAVNHHEPDVHILPVEKAKGPKPEQDGFLPPWKK